MKPNAHATIDANALSKEFRLLLSGMGAGAVPAGAPFPPLPPQADIDWSRFLELVLHHRVYPQLYAGLRENVRVPEDVRQTLRRHCEANTLRMLRYAGEMERLSRSLELRGIRSLALKGPVLAEALYGDLSRRVCKDLDVLVPMEDVEKAERLLLELGYEGGRNVPRVLSDWKWKAHHLIFTHPQAELQVEIHWRLNAEMGKEPPFEELWARRKPRPLAGSRVNMLGGEDLFLYLVSHGARHGWFRLRWLADIDRLVRQGGLRGNALLPHLRHYSALHLGGQALALANGLLNTPVPEALGPMMSGGRPRELARRAILFIREPIVLSPERMPKEAVKAYKRYLFALKTRRQKGTFLLRRLYPSFRDAEALPLPKPLHFLYFPLRPFVWLWRQFRQQA